MKDFGEGLSIGHRAAKNGHIVEVSRDRSRFRLVCTCGWSTPISAKRKTAFQMATDHASDAAFSRIPTFPLDTPPGIQDRARATG